MSAEGPMALFKGKGLQPPDIPLKGNNSFKTLYLRNAGLSFLIRDMGVLFAMSKLLPLHVTQLRMKRIPTPALSLLLPLMCRHAFL